MKAKKMYKEGGKLRGKTVTKEMADKEFKKKFEGSANFANKFAKYAETGVGPNGMPLSEKKRKEYANMAKVTKQISGRMKPNYRYVGTKLPAKDQPVYKKGGKLLTKKEAPKKRYSEKLEQRRAAEKEQRRAERDAMMPKRFGKGGKMMKYLKGGQVKLDANKDGKITGEDFKMLRKK